MPSSPRPSAAPRFTKLTLHPAIEYLDDHPEFTPDSLVEHIRAQVLESTKVSISAGIGPNAKVSSCLPTHALPVRS